MQEFEFWQFLLFGAALSSHSLYIKLKLMAVHKQVLLIQKTPAPVTVEKMKALNTLVGSIRLMLVGPIPAMLTPNCRPELCSGALSPSLSIVHCPWQEKCLEYRRMTPMSGEAASVWALQRTSEHLWRRSQHCGWNQCKCWSKCPPGCSRGQSHQCWSPQSPDTAAAESGRNLHPPHLRNRQI